MPKSKMTVDKARELRVIETEKMKFYGKVKTVGASFDGSFTLAFTVEAVEGKRDLEAERYLRATDQEYDGYKCYHPTADYAFNGLKCKGFSIQPDCVSILLEDYIPDFKEVYLRFPLGKKLQDLTPKEDLI